MNTLVKGAGKENVYENNGVKKTERERELIKERRTEGGKDELHQINASGPRLLSFSSSFSFLLLLVFFLITLAIAYLFTLSFSNTHTHARTISSSLSVLYLSYHQHSQPQENASSHGPYPLLNFTLHIIHPFLSEHTHTYIHTRPIAPPC